MTARQRSVRAVLCNPRHDNGCVKWKKGSDCPWTRHEGGVSQTTCRLAPNPFYGSGTSSKVIEYAGTEMLVAPAVKVTSPSRWIAVRSALLKL